jgi:hypothetical protein
MTARYAKRIVYSLNLLVILTHNLHSQFLLDKRIDFAVSAKTVPDALFLLSEKADVNIVFSPNFFDKSEKITLNFQNQALRSIITAILKNTDYGFKESNGSILLSKKIIVEYYDLCGYVRDSESGEALSNTAVFDPKTGAGVLTNGYGYYCIKLKKGTTNLQFSYVGYTKQELTVPIKMGAKLDIALKPNITLKEVVLVSSLVDKKVQEAPSQQNILVGKLKTFASAGGEPDLFRILQGLPGVQSGADGFGGLHIRGGNADQNLILLDDVPVFNPSHSAGLFSIFNTSLIKSAVLTKGGFPARYGGRLSSVLEVRTKEGNLEKVSASAGVGFLATTASLEVPIVKNKVSLLLGGRRSHIDNYLKNTSRKQKELDGKTGELDYFFYDFNAKLNTILSEKDRLYLSLYTGSDKYTDFSNQKVIIDPFSTVQKSLDYGYTWGNRIASLRWNHLYSNKLFSNITLISSHFNYNSRIEKIDSFFSVTNKLIRINADETRFNSTINETALRADFDYFLNEKNRLKMGLGITNRQFIPSILSNEKLFNFVDSMTSFKTPLDIDSTNYGGWETYAYISDEWKYKNWEINAGIHATAFYTEGVSNLSLQPRLNVQYFIKPKTAVSFSGSRMTQFLHLLTTTDAGLPNDLWVPATAKSAPENAWQATVGVHQKLGDRWLLNTEIFAKKMTGLLTYKDSLFIQNNTVDVKTWEDVAQTSKGTSIGWEVLLEKNKGNLTGWLSYTLSKAQRTYGNDVTPYRFDSRHVLHLNIAYHFADWLEASVAWAYQSGLPTADFQRLRDNFLFTDIFKTSDVTVKNNRLPAYHRLDVGLSTQFKTRKLNHQIQIGAYNIYNQKNAFLAFPSDKNKASWTQINALPLMPSIRYVLTVN